MADAVSGGDGLRVEADPVMAAVGEFRSIADELRDGLRQLVSEANEVVDGSWRGEAASAFNREWDEFHDAAKAIVADADTIADLVAHSVNLYVSEDETSAGSSPGKWCSAA
ncbi:WXG100 family type VII secretion target [Mycobacterium avium]|uniref:WXG100 family type VII secretion target n=1 Tax=Mycobacterium avium TaxID=1764 RepID=UPI000ADB35F9|nr:WXG100 family type VII secretion target [Mycobacterium avium]MDV3215713.1 WXG100 family type VII secretion target [Mycobacterium avium]